MGKQFGAKVSKSQQERYDHSDNWKDGKFVNLEKTSMSIDIQNLPKLIYKQFCKEKGREPEQPIPIIPFHSNQFLKPTEETQFIWYGHSVVLMRMQGKTILIDPMLGENAAPISPFPIKRFSENTLELINDFPEIDLLLLTHDHYDHLDLDSIEALKSKVKHYYVALGVGRHLVKWGVKEEDILEFDWWNKQLFDDIEITFTPTRHFSGRGLTDKAKSLWGGWAFKSEKENIWFSGDGGYGKHFKTIGEKLGPFDFAFMECGQYNENWKMIHMFPEQSVLAAKDAKVKKMMPVHWAGFALAQHHWTEPAVRFVLEAQRCEMDYCLPEIGAQVSYKDELKEHWWE